MKKYLGLEPRKVVTKVTRPGPIDNLPLFNSDLVDPSDLRENLIEDVDFVCVPDQAWTLLLDLFSICKGQHPIARKVSWDILLC